MEYRLKELCTLDDRLNPTAASALLTKLIAHIPETSHAYKEGYVNLLHAGITHLKKNQLKTALEFFHSTQEGIEFDITYQVNGKKITKTETSYCIHAFFATGLTNMLLSKPHEAHKDLSETLLITTYDHELRNQAKIYMTLLNSLQAMESQYPPEIKQKEFIVNNLFKELCAVAKYYFSGRSACSKKYKKDFVKGLNHFYHTRYEEASQLFTGCYQPIIINALGWNSHKKTHEAALKKFSPSIAYLADGITWIKRNHGDEAEIQLQKAIQLAQQCYDSKVENCATGLLNKLHTSKSAHL